jgi:glutamate 5-kinase
MIQRTQYLNAQNTFMELLNMDIIPLVNENDTLAVTVGRYETKNLSRC